MPDDFQIVFFSAAVKSKRVTGMRFAQKFIDMFNLIYSQSLFLIQVMALGGGYCLLAGKHKV